MTENTRHKVQWSPVALFKGLLMDLGFAGLIEQIEKRFGKAPTNIVIFLLLIGICIWTVKLMLSFIQEIGILLASDNFWDNILGIAYRLGFLALFFIAAMSWINGKILRDYEKLGDRYRELSELYGRMNAHFTREKEEISKLQSRLDSEVDRFHAHLDRELNIRGLSRTSNGEEPAASADDGPRESP